MQGMEVMLRSMGLASVLDAAKALAESGAVQKLVQFADDMEGVRNDLETIKGLLAVHGQTCPHCGATPHTGPNPGDDGTGLRPAAAEPGPDTGVERLSA